MRLASITLWRQACGVLVSGFFSLSAYGSDYVVAPFGGDFTKIQSALDIAVAGDTITVRAGTYNEKIRFTSSGNADAGYITLQAFEGELPILSGLNVSGSNMVLIEDRSYVKLIGFEIRDNLGVDDGSGVRITGFGL